MGRELNEIQFPKFNINCIMPKTKLTKLISAASAVFAMTLYTRLHTVVV